MASVGGTIPASSAAPSYVARHDRPQMHWIGTPQSSTTSLGIHKSDASTPRLVSETSAYTPRTTSEPPPLVAVRTTSIRTLPLQTLCHSASQQSHGRMLTPQRVRAPANISISATSKHEAQMPELLRGTSDGRLGRTGQVQIATAVPSFLPLPQGVSATNRPAYCSRNQEPKAIHQAPPALERLKATAAGYGFWDAMTITGGADRAEEVLHALAKLQQTLDDQQVDQRTLITELSAQWEERFAQVMECLQKSSTASASQLPSSDPFACPSGMTPAMLNEIERIWQHVDGLTGRLGELEIKQRDTGNADLEEPGNSGTCEDDGDRQRSCFQQLTDDGTQEAQDGDGELARRRLFKGDEANSGLRLNHRLDLVDDKLQKLSQELELLRMEVATSKISSMPTAELRTFGDTCLLEISTVETCVGDVPQQSMIHDDATSIRVPKPRGTGAGLLPPRDQAEESSGEEDMICGAGSPPRRVVGGLDASFGMTCTE
eukprot:TRINITY_DN2205_c0_g2_i1.p1 TRINITY_DN2205_c0_g2~~TRINITY_DN2205_c0_g2_i1.p1  ORF type:complete len:544 (+),score=88.17 TRINITY_DN2205_c0_g2_i1:168-1634(+)